jgi:hypothetical protein
MSSLSPKDRVSLCRFTFADGRCCRTPRFSAHPHFCAYHAQKEARTFASDKLAKDLAFFFSGDYLSANDLATALARLIPAVVLGHLKPRAARTIAYMAQSLLQAIHISQDEYSNAFGRDGWRKAVRNSVNGNQNYRFPPDPEAPKAQSPQPQPMPQQAQAPTPPPQPTPASAQRTPAQHASTPSPQPSSPSNQPAPLAPQPSPPPPTTMPQHSNASRTTTSQPLPAQQNRDPYVVHFDHNYRLRPSP